jgi:hypothetical protein
LLCLIELIQHLLHILSVHSLRLVPVDYRLVVVVTLALDVFVPGLEFVVFRGGRLCQSGYLDPLGFIFLFLFLLDQHRFVHVLQKVMLVSLEFFV